MQATQAKPRATVDGVDVVDDAHTTIGTAIGRLYVLRARANAVDDRQAAIVLGAAIGALEAAQRDTDELAALHHRGTVACALYGGDK